MREKLIDILTSFYGVDPMYFGVEAQQLADHLIANGVTVQGDKDANVLVRFSQSHLPLLRQ